MTTTSTAGTPLYESELSVELIDPNPDNPRKDLGDLSELVDSIRVQGILEPLVVEATDDPEDDTGTRYLVLAGHRRLAAAIRAGATAVPALIHEDPSPRHVRLERMLTENLQRADLTLVEEGDAYQLLIDLPEADLTPAKLAKRLSKSVKHVQQTVKAAGLPESTRERILRGQVSLEHAARMQQFVKDDEVMQRLDRAAEGGPMSLDRAIEEEKTRADQAKAVAKVARELRAAGREVIVGEDERIESRSARHVAGVIYEWPTTGDSRLPENYDALKHDDQTTEQLRVLEQQHFTDHPDGHLAVVESSSWSTLPRVRGYCLDESAHKSAEGVPEQHEESDEERAAREAREAAAAKRHEQAVKLAAAGVVRRRYLGEVATSEAAAKLAKESLLEWFNKVTNATKADSHRFEALRAFSEILLPNLAAPSRDEAALGKKVTKALERCDIAHLVVLRDIMQSINEELSLSSSTGPYAWDDDLTHSTTRRWRHTLRDVYGYEPSDIENELHAQHNTVEGGEPS